MIQPSPSQFASHKSLSDSPGSRVRKPTVQIATKSWSQGTPPELLGELRREAQTSDHRHQADVADLELAGHRLGGAQRHQAGLLDGPAPATEVQGDAG